MHANTSLSANKNVTYIRSHSPWSYLLFLQGKFTQCGWCTEQILIYICSSFSWCRRKACLCTITTPAIIYCVLVQHRLGPKVPLLINTLLTDRVHGEATVKEMMEIASSQTAVGQQPPITTGFTFSPPLILLALCKQDYASKVDANTTAAYVTNT